MIAAPQLAITAPLNEAARRMPAALVAGSADVLVEPVPGPGHRWGWRSPSGVGHIELSPLSDRETGLTVTAGSGVPVAVVDALTVELLGALERSWAPTVPPAHRGPARTPLRIAVAIVAVLIPALALAGSHVLAPPAPMDVAAAVTQFRTASASEAARTSASTPGTATRGAAVGGDASGIAKPAPDRGQKAQDGRIGATSAVSSGPRASTAPPASSRIKADDTQRGAARSSSASGQQQRRSAPALPEEGVYRYATQGYESIDQPSSRHDYPSETAMTIRYNDCGFVAHWQPLENRWDEMTICRNTSGSFIPTMATHREFYGQAKDSRYTCSDGFYAYRPATGATWTGRCSDDESTMQIQARTLGREPVRVGDQMVHAVHYVIEARISGGNEGTWKAERWVDPDSGLLVRAQASTDATSDSSVGTVRYREQTDVRLLSMTPER